jgi:hypothetical protein
MNNTSHKIHVLDFKHLLTMMTKIKNLHDVLSVAHSSFNACLRLLHNSSTPSQSQKISSNFLNPHETHHPRWNTSLHTWHLFIFLTQLSKEKMVIYMFAKGKNHIKWFKPSLTKTTSLQMNVTWNNIIIINNRGDGCIIGLGQKNMPPPYYISPNYW